MKRPAKKAAKRPAKRAPTAKATAKAPAKRAAAPRKQEMSASHKRVNRTLRLLMADQECAQADLADVLNIDPAQVSKAFSGLRSWKLDDLTTMADFFDVEPKIWFEDPANLLSGLERLKRRSAKSDVGRV